MVELLMRFQTLKSLMITREQNQGVHVAKELDTFQGRDKAYDEVCNPRRFTDNERGLRGGSHTSYSKGSDTNSRGCL